MQMTSWPRWLMIASVATAVFPVWRSPMISSRWPRPIGTIASIALRPVCIGSLTGLRSTTPGASRSISRDSLEPIGPLPSIGWPSALTTRPTSSSPTGTEMIRDVRLTVSPSLSAVYSPSRTAPTLSSSRFSAIPKTPCGNSSISPAIVFSMPCTRAMPSPTVTIVPTSATSTSTAKLPIWSRMILEISSAFMSICSTRSRAPRSLRGARLSAPADAVSPRAVTATSNRCRSLLRRLDQRLLQLSKLRRHAAVVHGAADPRDGAPDECGVDSRLDLHVATRRARQPGPQLLNPISWDLDSRGQFRTDYTPVVHESSFEGRSELRQERQPIGVREKRQQLREYGMGPAAAFEQRLQHC